MLMTGPLASLFQIWVALSRHNIDPFEPFQVLGHPVHRARIVVRQQAPVSRMECSRKMCHSLDRRARLQPPQSGRLKEHTLAQWGQHNLMGCFLKTLFLKMIL